jgi:carbon storage regulator
MEATDYREDGRFVMLILSRKSQESVVVGGDSGVDRMLKVTVLEIKGGRVRLGFDVPSDIPVHRMEVWERIKLNASEDS